MKRAIIAAITSLLVLLCLIPLTGCSQQIQEASTTEIEIPAPMEESRIYRELAL